MGPKVQKLGWRRCCRPRPRPQAAQKSQGRLPAPCGIAWTPTAFQPERGGAAGRHQRRPPLPGNVRPAHPVGGRVAAAARSAVRAVAVGAGDAPVEVKVLAWKKGGRNGVVIKGAGGPRSNGKPGDGTIRVGGRAPWGAEVEYAYATGYDGHGQVFGQPPGATSPAAPPC